MKIIAIVACLHLVTIPVIAGREPQISRPVSERVRMSTHIIVGEVIMLRVVNATDGREVARHSKDLARNEKMEVAIRVLDVLQSDRLYPLKPGDNVTVRFGEEGYTISVIEAFLTKTRRIFFLTTQAEELSYFFPLFGSSNLSCAEEKLGDVKAAIKSIADAAK